MVQCARRIEKKGVERNVNVNVKSQIEQICIACFFMLLHFQLLHDCSQTNQTEKKSTKTNKQSERKKKTLATFSLAVNNIFRIKFFSVRWKNRVTARYFAIAYTLHGARSFASISYIRFVFFFIRYENLSPLFTQQNGSSFFHNFHSSSYQFPIILLFVTIRFEIYYLCFSSKIFALSNKCV